MSITTEAFDAIREAVSEHERDIAASLADIDRASLEIEQATDRLSDIIIDIMSEAEAEADSDSDI